MPGLLSSRLCIAPAGWAVACLLAGAQLALAADDGPGLELFEKKIRPVLVERCYECHSAAAAQAKKLKGGLRLDTRDGLRQGGESGPAVTPGNTAKSLLVEALRHESFKMPPAGKLPDATIADFVKWIELGAPDPRDSDPPKPPPATIDFAQARAEHWAFQPPRKTSPPAVKPGAGPLSEIDRFVLARLEAEGLRPNPPAEKRDLLRRASLDLIGLPPTPEEMDAFLADESPTAFEAVVERLLASPHYGERWARHWLDVARYAEDQALANAKDSPHAYRYRDWVVQALNRDLPYDEFLRLQLAGDLLLAAQGPDARPPQDDYFAQLGGLGFQGLGQLYHRGNFAEQVMADELDDRIDTVSRGLLGLTVACARCHDHKYDPIPTRDYYSLAAAYQGSRLEELVLGSPADVARFTAFTGEVQQREAALTAWVNERILGVVPQVLRNLRPYLETAWQLRALRAHGRPADEKGLAADRKLLLPFLSRWALVLETADGPRADDGLFDWHKAARKAAAAPEANVAAPLPPAELIAATEELCRRAASLAAEYDRSEAEYRKAYDAAPEEERKKVKRAELPAEWKSLGKAVVERDAAPLNVRGADAVAALDEAARREHQARAAELEAFRKTGPSPLAKIHGVSGGGQAMKVHLRGNVERKGEDAPPGFLRILHDPAASGGGRFTRLELAAAIASPANPLTARVIVNRVWAKHFGRGLVGTPSNFGKLGDPPSHPELLDHLAVSFVEQGWSLKKLHRQILLSQAWQRSSAPNANHLVRDPENRLLWRHTPRRLDFEAWRDAVLLVSGRLDRTPGGPSQPLDQHLRRTLYSKISRSRIDPTLAMFDFPDANVSNEQRSVTTVAQQQLFVLNSPFMLDSSRALAERVRPAADDAARLRLAYRLAYGRAPTAEEQAFGLAYLAAAAPGQEGEPWRRYAQALLAANEFTWIP